MSEPRRKLSILVPDLPWVPEEEKPLDTEAWEAAAERAGEQEDDDSEPCP